MFCPLTSYLKKRHLEALKNKRGAGAEGPLCFGQALVIRGHDGLNGPHNHVLAICLVYFCSESRPRGLKPLKAGGTHKFHIEHIKGK